MAWSGKLPDYGIPALRRSNRFQTLDAFSGCKERAHACFTAQSNARKSAELAWRAGLPLMTIDLMLLAIPLTGHHPRRNRAVHLIMAVLLYLIYYNLLNLMQSWLEQEKLPFWAGLFGLHALAAALAGALFWRRLRHRPLFRTWVVTQRN